MRPRYGGGDSLRGRITIAGSGPDSTITIDYFRERKDNEAGWHDRHAISYDPAQQSIMATDRCEVLEYGGRCRDSGHTWAASPAFWTNIVDLLRSRLPAKSVKQAQHS